VPAWLGFAVALCYRHRVAAQAGFDSVTKVRWRSRARLLGSVAPYMPLIGGLGVSIGAGVAAVVVLTAAVLVFLLDQRARLPSGSSDGRVIVAGDTLTIRGVGGPPASVPLVTIRRDRIGGATWLSASDGGGSVRIVDRADRPIAEILLRDEREAADLLGALSMPMEPPRRIRATLQESRVRRAAAALAFAVGVASSVALWLYGQARVLNAAYRAAEGAWNAEAERTALGLFAVWPLLVAALAIPAGVALFFAAGYPEAFVTLGADGLRISTRRRHRTIAFAELAFAGSKGRWVTLTLRNGEDVELVLDGSTAAWLSVALRRALDLRAARVPSPIESHLLPGGAAPTALEVLASAYRRTELPAEALWNVVEDSTAPADVRAAAALVLRSTLPAEATLPRLRVAAEHTLAPTLRVALDAAATLEDHELDGRESQRSGGWLARRRRGVGGRSMK